MKYSQLSIAELGVSIEISTFSTPNGVTEWHAMLHVEPLEDTFMGQYQRICLAENWLLKAEMLQGAEMVFKRYFLSDSTNQQPLMQEETSHCTISYIQQPPLDGSKVALWIHLLQGADIEYQADQAGSTIVSHNGYRHIWIMGLMDNHGDSHQQTHSLLTEYEKLLADQHATMADNCIRTWFFVRDVDTQYNGLVVARRNYFNYIGLTADTHYISSTGIGGNPSDPKALVQLGSYAVTGFQPEQQRYLYAPSHLNRTSDYGVTFERGTLMQYGDRDHVYISGTASIDNRGEVVHVGDIRKQTLRMWENVEKLLEEAGMTMGHCAQIIVYLRDTADYKLVSQMFAERFPEIPTVITLAPVCRPTWLIEMECIAIKENNNPQYADF
jgi:enamine deaminase RidA (YjgF/YER057c/UK114 family)